MLRYFNCGPRNFQNLPDVPAQRFNWEFYIIFSGRISPEPLARKVAGATRKNFWLFAPRQRYCWQYDEPIADRAVFHFAYVPELVNQVLAAEGFLALTLTEEQLSKVRILADEVRHYYEKLTPLSILAYEKAVSTLSLLALGERVYPVQQSVPTLAKDRVERAIAWYREHLAEHVNLENVAAGTHVSASHLRRHFYQETGAGPSQTFLTLRMQRAAEILSTTSVTLERASEMCGFSSATDFCRVFKRYYKTTAHVWRNQLGNEEMQKAHGESDKRFYKGD